MKPRRALAGLALLGGALLIASSLGCAGTSPVPTGISPSSASPLSRPLWLPDGSQVVFSRYFQGVFVVDVAGTRLNTIPRNAPIENSFDAGNYAPSLSPDGTRVAYVSIFHGDNVYVVSEAMSGTDDSWLRKLLRFLGFDARRLTDDGRNDINPAWSPDGGLIAYTAYGGRLTVMAVDGSDKRVLAPSVWSRGYPPVWSPDGSQIAFVGLERDSKGEYRLPLYVVRPDGSGLTKLWDVVSVPTWAPDGSRIAFFLAEGESAVLYTWDLNGADPQLLHSVEEADFSRVRVRDDELLYDTLSWSPDGSALLFASEYVEGHVVSVDDGRILVDLERGGAAWSPDGARIAVVTSLYKQPSGVMVWTDFREVLYTMARDGTDKRVLVRGTDEALAAEHGEWRDVAQGIAACAKGYVVPQPRRNPGLVEDCGTLIRVRDKLAGDAYLNWGTAFRIEDWQGVTVAGDPPRVRRLESNWTTSPTLSGVLPPELGRLSTLEEFILGKQKLTGGIPPELGNLTELRTLHLVDMQLEGNIPPELGNLAKLERLDLRNNNLSGNIPPELGKLTALEKLVLFGNELSGCVPAALYARYGSGLTVLQTDNMDRCK